MKEISERRLEGGIRKKVKEVEENSEKKKEKSDAVRNKDLAKVLAWKLRGLPFFQTSTFFGV